MPHNFTCQYCGKEFYSSKNAYRNPKFCGRECFFNSNRETRKCEFCGKEFETALCSKKRFCSQSCGQKNRADPSKKGWFVCEWCKKQFKNWVYRQNRFCSNQCRSEFAARQSKNYKPEAHITLKCKTCGEPYENTISMVRLRGSSCCSMECYAEQKAKRMRGKNNPNWKGGFNPDDYGPNWGRQARKARKRDNYTCQICGYQSRTRNLDVHHIKPLRTFNGDYKRANRLSNLICLCRTCHKKVEYNQIPCPKPKPIKSS